MRKVAVVTLVAVVAGLAFMYALMYSAISDISTPTLPKTASEPPVSGGATYFVSVVSRDAPSVIYQGYQPIMDYLNRHSPYHFELKLGGSYRDSVLWLASGEVLAAFLGGYVYSEARETMDIEPVLKPLNADGGSTARAVVVVPDGSRIQGVRDLYGRRVALPSADSISGNWLTREALPQAGMGEGDLGLVGRFEHHQSVISHVLQGDFDAGVVKERLALPYLKAGLRVVARSRAFPGSPLVVGPLSQRGVVECLVKTLSAVNLQHPNIREITRDWDPDFAFGFTAAADSDYDPVRLLLHSSAGVAP